jgi:eukaryotic-like serine/threonine-protein kinase
MASLSVLEGLFAKLLELPVGERERAIAEWTAGRPELRAELEAMLRHLDEAEKFLEVDAPRGQEGRMFGPWRAERRIGMGGMGDVYLASRADGQFEMQVALKLLGAGLGSEAERKRFLEERQILATLDHPYIARLLDGGISEEGQPYLVMELVDGVALGKAIEGMARRERLRVMRDVVAAVEYAHRNLVVHADLKPSNVMVRRDGIVKLVDFGIAWVEREGFEAARGMSAQYASPEQKRGERPTVASDVYGLGVLLGEVMGREDEELRAIADRATRDSAAERYATVEALGRELERLADGRAVEAMGKAPVYRVKKYVVRHWFAVSAAALVVAFAGYAVEQKIQAEQHFNELKRAARIMVFDVYEGIQYLNPPPEVVERIVESSQQVLEALAQTRDPDAGLRFDIASAEERLAELLILNGGDRKRADALLDHAVGMARRLVVERPDSGSYHRLLASGLQYVAQRERERGRREAALAALREMEQHVRRAIALPEPRSRDWMYLSLIDLKRGEIEGGSEPAGGGGGDCPAGERKPV